GCETILEISDLVGTIIGDAILMDAIIGSLIGDSGLIGAMIGDNPVVFCVLVVKCDRSRFGRVIPDECPVTGSFWGVAIPENLRQLKKHPYESNDTRLCHIHHSKIYNIGTGGTSVFSSPFSRVIQDSIQVKSSAN
ncbi:1240_t:CDS:2, partial [Gigaspora margarita]